MIAFDFRRLFDRVYLKVRKQFCFENSCQILCEIEHKVNDWIFFQLRMYFGTIYKSLMLVEKAMKT